MKITYTVGKESGRTVEVDTEVGEWLVDKRRAVAVDETPVEATEAPRVKRKYTRRAPVAQAPTEDDTEGTEDEAPAEGD